ncbi:hypothetical protein ACVW1A_000224 [Bradyrhizobium sp. LB1.3]
MSDPRRSGPSARSRRDTQGSRVRSPARCAAGARERHGQRGRSAGWTAPCRRGAHDRPGAPGPRRWHLDVFENQLHLIGIELLRAFAETCALVLLHEQFEAFDGLFGRSQFALDMKARRAFIVSATTLGFNHRLLRAEERSQIGGQRCKMGGVNRGRRHIRKLSSQIPARNRLSGLSQFAAAGVATIRSPTRFQFSPSNSASNCTRVRCTTPSLICGHSKRPSRPSRL